MWVCWVAVVSHSVVSDSLWPHRLYRLLGSTVHGISQTRILEWVAISFSRKTQVSCIAGRFFTVWATGKTWAAGYSERQEKTTSSPRCFDSIHTAPPALREDPPQVTITARRSLSKFIWTPELAGGCMELEAGYCYFHLRTNKLRQRQHTPATNQPTNSICYLISCKQLTPENKFKGGGMGLGVPPWHTGWQ